MCSLLPPPPAELDPETQAVVDEVCDALEWFDGSDGSVQYLVTQQFRGKWLTALLNTSDVQCRQRIVAACDAIVHASGEFVGADGRIYPREQIGEHQGDVVYMSVDGEMQRVLRWPVAFYANGEPCYERRERAA